MIERAYPRLRLRKALDGGASRDRTDDILLARWTRAMFAREFV